MTAKRTGEPADSVLAMLDSPAAAERHSVPGPTLEGYIYPATYVFPLGTPSEEMAAAMVVPAPEAGRTAKRGST